MILTNLFICLLHCRYMYDERKGLFCEVRGFSQTECLGKGKGRLYKLLDDQSRLSC